MAQKSEYRLVPGESASVDTAAVQPIKECVPLFRRMMLRLTSFIALIKSDYIESSFQTQPDRPGLKAFKKRVSCVLF